MRLLHLTRYDETPISYRRTLIQSHRGPAIPIKYKMESSRTELTLVFLQFLIQIASPNLHQILQLAFELSLSVATLILRLVCQCCQQPFSLFSNRTNFQ